MDIAVAAVVVETLDKSREYYVCNVSGIFVHIICKLHYIYFPLRFFLNFGRRSRADTRHFAVDPVSSIHCGNGKIEYFLLHHCQSSIQISGSHTDPIYLRLAVCA